MMATGRIKFFNERFGFIIDDSGEEYFFHVSGARQPERLAAGTPVRFEMGVGPKGPCAIHVSVMEVSAHVPGRKDGHAPAPETPVVNTPNANAKDPLVREPGGAGAKSASENNLPPPYHFVPVDIPAAVAEPPVFHDGSNPNQTDLVSGELKCEIKVLTPLLAGNFQYEAKDVSVAEQGADFVRLSQWDIAFPVAKAKKIIEPLFWNDRVVIPGTAIKGTIRQNLGALLCAPMERVAERTYSYRPNLDDELGSLLQPRAALVVKPPDDDGQNMQIRLRTRTDRPHFHTTGPDVRPEPRGAGTVYRYRGGLDGVGLLAWLKKPPKKKKEMKPTDCVHHWVEIGNQDWEANTRDVPGEVVLHFWRTLKHLEDDQTGHLGRLPSLEETDKNSLRSYFGKLKKDALKRDSVIFVEWDENAPRVTSIGNSFRYRIRYWDTVRTRCNGTEWQPREVLQPLPSELRLGDVQPEAPAVLSGTRLLAGYVCGEGENYLPALGKNDFQRLAGRFSPNIAIELLDETCQRFVDDQNGNGIALPLKPLGAPKPSSPEYYLKHNPGSPSGRHDGGTLLTYGDLPDDPVRGDLNGRKFYLNQPDAAKPQAANPHWFLQWQAVQRWRADQKFASDVLGRLIVLADATFPMQRPFPNDLMAFVLQLLSADPGLQKFKPAWEQRTKIARDMPSAEVAERKRIRKPGLLFIDAAIHLAGDQAALVRFVSAPGVRFRFTLRFRDLRKWELGALLASLDPELIAMEEVADLPPLVRQYLDRLTKQKSVSAEVPLFAIKLGHGRPLGMGSVKIEVQAARLWSRSGAAHSLADKSPADLTSDWIQALVRRLFSTDNEAVSEARAEVLLQWLKVHQYVGRSLAEYPSQDGEIFAFHTRLRRTHAKGRRKAKPGNLDADVLKPLT